VADYNKSKIRISGVIILICIQQNEFNSNIINRRIALFLYLQGIK